MLGTLIRNMIIKNLSDNNDDETINKKNNPINIFTYFINILHSIYLCDTYPISGEDNVIVKKTLGSNIPASRAGMEVDSDTDDDSREHGQPRTRPKLKLTDAGTLISQNDSILLTNPPLESVMR